MALTFPIVLVFIAAILIARGQYVAAVILGVLALPVLVFAARRRNRS